MTGHGKLLHFPAVPAPLHIRYAGVAVASAVAVKDIDADGLFVVTSDPMPVGTLVDLAGQDIQVRARVQRVVESTLSDVAGMRLRLLGEPGATITIGGTTVALIADGAAVPDPADDLTRQASEARARATTRTHTAADADAPLPALVDQSPRVPPAATATPGPETLPVVFADLSYTPPPEVVTPTAPKDDVGPARPIQGAGRKARRKKR